MESVSTIPFIRPDGGWEPVLFLDVLDRICDCCWPTPIPGRVDSFVGMSVLTGYEIRNSVSGTRWVMDLVCKARKGWICWWVTVQALNPGVELNIKLGTPWVSINQGISHQVLVCTSEEGPYVGWVWISMFYINMGSTVLQNGDTVYGSEL